MLSAFGCFTWHGIVVGCRQTSQDGHSALLRNTCIDYRKRLPETALPLAKSPKFTNRPGVAFAGFINTWSVTYASPRNPGNLQRDPHLKGPVLQAAYRLRPRHLQALTGTHRHRPEPWKLLGTKVS